MENIDGCIALVTGGSRGIGQAICTALAGQGVHVYTCARSQPGLTETEAMASSLPGSVIGLQADVGSGQAMEAVFDRIEADRGHLDILVNNAGVLGPRTPIEDVTLEQWRHTQRVNVDGVFLACTLAIGLMRAAGEGVIINLSSSVGRRGRARWGPYAASKHAVEGLSDTLADELVDDNICVVSVNPGGTATDMRHQAYPDEDPDTLPSAADVAEVLVDIIGRLDVDQTGQKLTPMRGSNARAQSSTAQNCS